MEQPAMNPSHHYFLRKRSRTSDALENEIRHKFHKLGVPAEQLMRDYKLKRGKLRRIVCGPLTPRGASFAVERTYAAPPRAKGARIP